MYQVIFRSGSKKLNSCVRLGDTVCRFIPTFELKQLEGERRKRKLKAIDHWRNIFWWFLEVSPTAAWHGTSWLYSHLNGRPPGQFFGTAHGHIFVSPLFRNAIIPPVSRANKSYSSVIGMTNGVASEVNANQSWRACAWVPSRRTTIATWNKDYFQLRERYGLRFAGRRFRMLKKRPVKPPLKDHHWKIWCLSSINVLIPKFINKLVI